MEDGLKIGTCGFGRAKAIYAAALHTVEIQHTFYQPPAIKTLEKWRAEVPDDFEFTIKAWQLITHETSSPTYRRLKKELTEKEFAEAGFFKPTDIVKEALEVTLASAQALSARTILFQCPAKFKQTDENIENLSMFMSSFDRGDLHLVWEPRGAWDDDVIKDLCSKLDLWHVVDPYSRPTVTPQNCYYRLHGHPRWRYTYEEDELEELVTLLPEDRLSYVFFNNITMKDDAERFQKIVMSAGR